MTDERLAKILDELKEALKKAKKTNRLQPPAAAEDIAEWERSHGAVLPEEIKQFLMFSNGFEYGMNYSVFALDDIKVIKNWVGVPDGWLKHGTLIGDGCYIVSDGKGKLIRCDTECAPLLSDLDFAAWLEDRVLERVEEDIDEDE